MKESTPTFPLNPLRWIQKRAKDYWKYTKANPLKSLVMTGTALLGIGLCVAGTIFTLGVAPAVLAGMALVVGAQWVLGLVLWVLIYDVKHKKKK